MDKDLKNCVTILVNSCDAYSDLWYPFFALFKKYWGAEGAEIVLNTESKEFQFDGLNIKTIHPKSKNAPYGRRMIEVLKQINSEYIILFLDDFFLRSKVKGDVIERIIDWMDRDKSIACFYNDCLDTYAEWEKDKYLGFKRIPWGASYTLNMQVGVWRRKKLIKYWRDNISPWEWEEYCNVLSFNKKSDKFYALTSFDNSFCDYGHNEYMSMFGVYSGKWILEDVEPLFKKEGIEIDFKKLGIYDANKEYNRFSNFEDNNYLIKKRLGLSYWFDYRLFCIRKYGFKKIRSTSKRKFFQYIDCLQKEAIKDFIKKNPNVEINKDSYDLKEENY